MTSLAFDTPRLDPHWAYLADGPVSAAMGIALLLAAAPLTSLAGWSLPPGFFLGIGVFLLPWAVLNFLTGRTARPAPALVWGIIAVDGAWVLGSLLLLVLFWSELSAWGIALIAVQAASVSGVFAAKLWGARALVG